MNFKEKLITVASVIIFISFITALIFREIGFILFGIIMCIFLFYVYLYNNEVKEKKEE